MLTRAQVSPQLERIGARSSCCVSWFGFVSIIWQTGEIEPEWRRDSSLSWRVGTVCSLQSAAQMQSSAVLCNVMQFSSVARNAQCAMQFAPSSSRRALLCRQSKAVQSRAQGAKVMPEWCQFSGTGTHTPSSRSLELIGHSSGLPSFSSCPKSAAAACWPRKKLQLYCPRTAVICS